MKNKNTPSLELKQDINRLVNDNRKLFNYRADLSLPPFYRQGWFSVDGLDYWILVQMYVRNPGRLKFIIIANSTLKHLTLLPLINLKQRCLELSKDKPK